MSRTASSSRSRAIRRARSTTASSARSAPRRPSSFITPIASSTRSAASGHAAPVSGSASRGMRRSMRLRRRCSRFARNPARVDRNGHRHGPPSHSLGVPLRQCARHTELVRAGFRPMLPSRGQHLHPDDGRPAGLRFHRRRRSRTHYVLGTQSAALGPDGETRFNVRESLLSHPRIITIDPARDSRRPQSRALLAAAARHRRCARACDDQRASSRKISTITTLSRTGATVSKSSQSTYTR